jgi:hypothetical protein
MIHPMGSCIKVEGKKERRENTHTHSHSKEKKQEEGREGVCV